MSKSQEMQPEYSAGEPPAEPVAWMSTINPGLFTTVRHEGETSNWVPLYRAAQPKLSYGYIRSLLSEAVERAEADLMAVGHSQDGPERAAAMKDLENWKAKLQDAWIHGDLEFRRAAQPQLEGEPLVSALIQAVKMERDEFNERDDESYSSDALMICKERVALCKAAVLAAMRPAPPPGEVETLRKQLAEMTDAWRACCRGEVAKKLAAEGLVQPPPADRGTTHADGCWGWGPKHYDCALAEVKHAHEVIAHQGIQLWQGQPPIPGPGMHPNCTDPCPICDRMDAERYRFLRDQRRWYANTPPAPGINIKFEYLIADDGEALDAAIDKELERATSTKGANDAT